MYETTKLVKTNMLFLINYFCGTFAIQRNFEVVFESTMELHKWKTPDGIGAIQMFPSPGSFLEVLKM